MLIINKNGQEFIVDLLKYKERTGYPTRSATPGSGLSPTYLDDGELHRFFAELDIKVINVDPAERHNLVKIILQ